MTTETVKLNYHPNWLRFMYVANIFVAGGFGLAFLIAPSAVASAGIAGPVEESLWAAGYAYSFMVTLAVCAALGLRSPLKFSATLLVQAATKIIWTLAIIVPRLAGGSLPSWAIGMTALFVVWAVGDIIAIPWRHFLTK